MARIINTSFLKNRTLSNCDGQSVYKSSHADFHAAAKEIYQHLDVSYRKFFKMDALSKSAFLCCEFLLKGIKYDLKPEKIGVFLVNKSSSLDTDERYQKSTFTEPEIQHNPALFVYTLPNIMIGELCIRHGFKGEQCMWINPDFDAELVANYVSSLFENRLIEACVLGWVDFYDNHENVFLSWVESEPEPSISLSDQQIEKNALNRKNLISIFNQLTSLT